MGPGLRPSKWKPVAAGNTNESDAALTRSARSPSIIGTSLFDVSVVTYLASPGTSASLAGIPRRLSRPFRRIHVRLSPVGSRYRSHPSRAPHRTQRPDGTERPRPLARGRSTFGRCAAWLGPSAYVVAVRGIGRSHSRQSRGGVQWNDPVHSSGGIVPATESGHRRGLCASSRFLRRPTFTTNSPFIRTFGANEFGLHLSRVLGLHRRKGAP